MYLTFSIHPHVLETQSGAVNCFKEPNPEPLTGLENLFKRCYLFLGSDKHNHSMFLQIGAKGQKSNVRFICL